jgi:hypothetical protein
MTQFELTFWDDDGHHYTITEAVNQRVTSRMMEWTENYPRKLTVTLDNRTTIPADNLLSTSFAGWDAGTGALDVGVRVNYFVYRETAPTLKTEVFWGIITEISQASNGILTIIAKDYLEKFEYLQPSAIIFKNYCDLTQKATTEGIGSRTIDGCTETGIVWPPAFVGIAVTDVETVLTGTGTYLALLSDMVDLWEQAQAFVALGDGLIGVRYQYTSMDITTGGNITCAIQADNGGTPSGIDLASSVFSIPLDSTINTAVQVDFTNELASHTVPLEKGRKYWIVWRCDAAIVGTSVGITYHDMTASAPYTNRFYSRCLTPVVGWFYTFPYNFNVHLDFADYAEVVPEDYYLSGTTIVCNSNGVATTTVSGGYYSGHIYRGKVSYYYGTVTTEDIFTRLIGFTSDPDVYGEVNTNFDTTYALYQTRGKSVGECFRELCDTFETIGAYTGYQHAIAAYRNDDDEDIITAGWRPFTFGYTFSHGADSATDDEIRIVSVNLKRTTSQRPASVIVVGKAATGAPIIVQRDDRALITSFRTKSKLTLTTTHTDESINTFADADRKAWQILDSFARGTWEGTITVAGVYPDLFQLQVDSGYYGAGGHIHLKYSPLGINNVEFHVKGIVLHENTTEVQISNEDMLMLNVFTESRGRAERSESFVAPDDPFATAFVSGYTSAVEIAATMYMQLCTADSTGIDEGIRVLCTRTANSRYNDSTYHAEFETINGHTIDGTNHVMQLELWDAASGGTRHATVALYPSEHFPKWRTTRVIAEIHCKAA